MTLPSLAPGALFGAHWIVGRVLGKHELAVVYEAEDAHKARFAALKLFETALARDTAAWQRFEALTRSLAELPGEGIARSYDVGVFEGRPFVASECSVFPTLARYVSERGPLAPRAFRDTLLTLASALEASHRAGIVHGNLKPQNVFVSVDNPGWARLTDFGVAELREAARVNQPRTLGWNAPEVTPEPPTAASDLFALGLLAFFSLSGSPWYSAQRSSVASSAERSRTASERASAYGGDIPAGLDAWFERALAHEPRDRFSSASDMAQAFVRALDEARSNPPSAVGPLSATVPVAVKSPFAHSNPPPQQAPVSKLDPNGPTAPQLAVTETLPARQAAPGLASTPAPHPVPAN
ncbi:MAG TPA: serine/threonine-protein kinase, partial [Polyangiaceae bacterium]|nr:serine/threonine-protein kinase [Polyangiaceae bacterium]